MRRPKLPTLSEVYINGLYTSSVGRTHCDLESHMPGPGKRHPEENLDQTHESKRLKHWHPPPKFWDNLSKVWLTKDALEELNRRNAASERPVPSARKHTHRPLTRRFQATLKRHTHTLVPDPLDSCKKSVREIKSFSRHGGPDLSDVRNYPDPNIPDYQPMSVASSQTRKRRAGPSDNDTAAKRTTTKSSTTAYNQNFQQHLIEHGIYPRRYKYSNGCTFPRPNNWEEITERLAQPRRSLSPSRFSEQEFERFDEEDTNAYGEKRVATEVIRIIDGDIGDTTCVGGDYPFSNLAPLTDGSIAHAKPDHFFGNRPDGLKLAIRKDLKDKIIPTTPSHRPILPNFFLEAKGPNGSLPVCLRQACYDGALAARGMHCLQSYMQEPVYDNNAYTITSTYHGGMLKLYTTHLTAPTPEHGGGPKYIMTQLKALAMTGDSEAFRKGATAYRNARDWAKEQRDKFIRSANERHAQSQSEVSSTSDEVASTPITQDDSDTVTSD
ncbi:hypothetical protein MferCBS31731_004285 [Microsporum ferrugineum]